MILAAYRLTQMTTFHKPAARRPPGANSRVDSKSEGAPGQEPLRSKQSPFWKDTTPILRRHRRETAQARPIVAAALQALPTMTTVMGAIVLVIVDENDVTTALGVGIVAQLVLDQLRRPGPPP